MTTSYNIGFALVGEHSSYYAALGLARVVRDRGHNAVFFVSEKTVFAELVTAHGFKVAEIPPGHEAHFAKPRTARFRLWKRLRIRAVSIRLEQDYLADLLETNAIDLCFLDAVRADLYPYALALARKGIPAMLVSPSFASKFGTGYPPVFSSQTCPGTARPGFFAGAAHTLLWAWALGTRGRGHAFDRIEYAQMVVRKWLDQMRNVSFERRLRRFGQRSAWSEWKRRPLIPEIVFGHRVLDWPAIAADPARYYFGTTDLSRAVTDFDWSIVDPDKPVAYCNLSTIHGFENVVSGAERRAGGPDLAIARFRMAERYVMAVLACFSQRKDWQLLIACGPFCHTLKTGAHAPNIHLFERLPQLAVLRRADLAITWGGAGTVRECVNHGVPMIVLPAWTDQFGNAARVVSSNVGVRGDITEITPEKLTAMVERVLPGTSIRASSTAMRKQCNPNQEVGGLVQFVRHHTGLEF